MRYVKHDATLKYLRVPNDDNFERAECFISHGCLLSATVGRVLVYTVQSGEVLLGNSRGSIRLYHQLIAERSFMPSIAGR